MVLWAGEGERKDVYPLLERLLQTEYGLPELPELARTERGKPWFPAHPELHFNVSHSGGLLLCGAGEAPGGVDIERVRPRRESLARHVLGETEYAWFEARGLRWEDFYSLWTMKEARCKCTGAGLSQAPRSIAVPLLEPGQTGALDGFSFRVYGGADWRAAACVSAPARPPQAIRWQG